MSFKNKAEFTLSLVLAFATISALQKVYSAGKKFYDEKVKTGELKNGLKKAQADVQAAKEELIAEEESLRQFEVEAEETNSRLDKKISELKKAQEKEKFVLDESRAELDKVLNNETDANVRAEALIKHTDTITDAINGNGKEVKKESDGEDPLIDW